MDSVNKTRLTPKQLGELVNRRTEMKRSVIVGLVVVAILGIVTTVALASNAKTTNALDTAEQVESVLGEEMNTETAVTQEQPAVPAGQNFVDEDGDGVCDTCGSVPGSGMGSQNGNGPSGSNFVDEDGDGVCDTCGSVPGSGMGSQNGNGAMGSNFVDLDGDGVCDTCGMAPADGTGNQYGRQAGQGRSGRWNN
jgi:type II secretory pathway pseudopilin PulG